MQIDHHNALNLGQLHDISGGDISFERELIDLYRNEFANTLENLTVALASNDQKSAILYSHDIKGSSANIGAEAVRLLGERMEYLAREGQLTEASVYLPMVREAFQVTMKLFMEYFGSN
eukprot:TRINITY_DN148_c0_g1_i1.p1 TRINITY_DN148_c0_g1~~TRINITY_DN148_c0_g1_i1.p1  ORF type:complete len:119 (-),score=25.42 TRINITY_DN148_c0_g1_i1:267-623(-)